MSHTPGEWTYDADQLWTDEHNAIVRESIPDYQNTYPIILVRAGGFFVADCGCHEYTKANARLIAAAPDLLAACEDVEWVSMNDDGPEMIACPMCYHSKEEGHKSDCRLSAAIARARGEE
jgi:hypothetical protein